ncbi:DoxX family protein [Nocardioides sp. cx-169]|uniref:DoxX family protein n=1 Tax=Nocardioides sp. cx-169 TaxID=2899080 RepID=UPI001E4C6D03|nr:DoxX family protein [Nocardioides sp. cx-169]MCD4533038.1 DoxX family protein [Nocardioides sp. cx-169]
MTEIDLGMLLIRLALGPMLVVHGLNKVWGPGGLAGTTGWFAGIGLRPAWLHARVAAVTEIGAGTLLTLGLLTGPVATAFVGLMVVAWRTDHRGKGYFVFKGGAEYVVLVALIAVGVAAVGPGEWSLDALLGLDVSGAVWATVAGVGGVLAAGLMLAACYRPSAPDAPQP